MLNAKWKVAKLLSFYTYNDTFKSLIFILSQFQNKELVTDYNRLQQQYTRLSSEHGQLNSQLKRNFQLYKEQKTNEITSLDGR